MKQVAVVVQRFPVVSETFVADHVIGLHRSGWEPIVLCGALDVPLMSALQARTGLTLGREVVEVRRSSPGQLLAEMPTIAAMLQHAPRAVMRRSGLAFARRAVAFRRAFRRTNPKVVHAHFADMGLIAALAASGAVPVVVDFHGWDFNVFAPRFGWGALAQALRGCTLVAHSDFARRRIEGRLGVPVRLVRLGVDFRLFRAAERQAIWPLPLRCLVVGRLVASKGQEFALRALALLRTGDLPIDARLTLVGEGPDRSFLEKLAAQLGIAQVVRFTGALDPGGVASEMAGSDLLLVPSVRAVDGAEEAFGRVVIEGFAAGLPIVASTIGGLPDAIGDAGWTVPPADASALDACVREILRAWTPRMCRERSLARAAHFSIEQMWRDYLEVVEETGA